MVVFSSRALFLYCLSGYLIYLYYTILYSSFSIFRNYKFDIFSLSILFYSTSFIYSPSCFNMPTIYSLLASHPNALKEAVQVRSDNQGIERVTLRLDVNLSCQSSVCFDHSNMDGAERAETSSRAEQKGGKER